jgi:hypothetical protein
MTHSEAIEGGITIAENMTNSFTRRSFLKSAGASAVGAMSQKVVSAMPSATAATMRGDYHRAFIKNHRTWHDQSGNPIYAHDGGVSRFGDKFYWYGTSYAGNPSGLFGMTRPHLWNGVELYSSDNLASWSHEGVVLSRPEKGWGNLGTSGRPHVFTTRKQKSM